VRRFLGGLVIVVIALAAVAGAVLLLQSRDDAGVRDAAGPGERVTDRCPAHRAPIAHDRRRLSRDQVQTALAEGNVIITYGGGAPPIELRRLQRDLTGPFDAEIAAAGQAVILAEGPVMTTQARAWGRQIDAEAPQDQKLRDFAEAWLGEGAPKPCQS
jgi:Protein of unknown function (DUF3105)